MRITNEIVWFGKEKQHDFSLANNCQWPLDTFPNSMYTYPSNSYNLQTLATIVTYHTDTWNEMVLNLALKPFISLMNNFQSITLKVYTWIGQRLIRARIDVKKWWKQCLEIAQKDNEVNASLLTNTNTHTHTDYNWFVTMRRRRKSIKRDPQNAGIFDSHAQTNTITRTYGLWKWKEKKPNTILKTKQQQKNQQHIEI